MAIRRKKNVRKRKSVSRKKRSVTARRSSGGSSAYAVARARSGRAKSDGVKLDSWKKAGLASLVMRAGEGLVFYAARSAIKAKPLSEQEKTLKTLSVAFPAAVAFFAKKIPVEGLFPIAVDRTVNGVINMSDKLTEVFDMRFLDKKDAQPKAVVAQSGVRRLQQTRAQIPYFNGRVSLDRSAAQNRSGAVSVEGYRR